MKLFRMLGIIVGAALLTAAPFSLHSTPKKAGLYIDKADARVVHRRRLYYGYYGVPYYGYGYGVGREYYVYKYPDGYPISYYGYGYTAYYTGYAPLGIDWGNWGGWGGM